MAWQPTQPLSPVARYIKAARESVSQGTSDSLVQVLAHFENLSSEERQALGYAIAGYGNDELWELLVAQAIQADELSVEERAAMLVAALHAGHTDRARRLFSTGATLQTSQLFKDPWTSVGLSAANEQCVITLTREELLSEKDKASFFLRAAHRNLEDLASALWAAGIDLRLAEPIEFWSDAHEIIATPGDLIDFPHRLSPEQVRIVALVDEATVRHRVAARERLDYRPETLAALLPYLHPEDVQDKRDLFRRLVDGKLFDSLEILFTWPHSLAAEDFNIMVAYANEKNRPAMAAYLLDKKNEYFGRPTQSFDLRL